MVTIGMAGTHSDTTARLCDMRGISQMRVKGQFRKSWSYAKGPGGCAGILWGSRGLHCSQEWRVNTPVGSTRGASAVKGQHSCGGCWACIDSPGLAPLWGQKRVATAVRGQHKLQALVYNILPSTTAVFSYAIGSRKLSAYEQFFLLVVKQ